MAASAAAAASVVAAACAMNMVEKDVVVDAFECIYASNPLFCRVA